MTRKRTVTVITVICAIALILGFTSLLPAATWQPLNRPGFVSVRLDPSLPSSLLLGTSHMPILDRFFASEAERFGHSLAEMLGKTVFKEPLFVVPGNLPEAHQAIREQGEPDSFLLTVDLVPSYGLEGDGFAGICATLASFFLLSPLDLFTYSVHLQAQVDAFYIAPDGTRISLASKLYRLQASARGDFFQVMDMRQEVEWITDLTRATQEAAQRAVMAELPANLLERAWRQAGERMQSAPMVARKRPHLKLPQLPAADTLVAESATGMEEMVRQASRSVCRVGAAGGTGSGFIVSPRGFVVTRLGALGGERKATVQFHHGEELPADLIFADPRNDLAVLSIPLGDYASLAFGGSAAVRPDDALLIFGFAGRNDLSIVSGQLSGPAADPRLATGTPLPAESSGGPVLNRRGEVIGMAMPQESGARLLPIGLLRQSLGTLADSYPAAASPASESVQVSYTSGIQSARPVVNGTHAAQ